MHITAWVTCYFVQGMCLRAVQNIHLKGDDFAVENVSDMYYNGEGEVLYIVIASYGAFD